MPEQAIEIPAAQNVTVALNFVLQLNQTHNSNTQDNSAPEIRRFADTVQADEY